MLSITVYEPRGTEWQVPFPENWDEFTPDELRQIGTALAVNADIALLATVLLEHRLAVSGVKNPQKTIRRIVVEDLVLEFLPHIEKLLSKVDRTVNPFPVLKNWWHTLQGPADNFRSLTCGEFEDCEVFFQSYCENQDIEHLRMIATILWRPTRGGRIVPYKGYDVERGKSFFREGQGPNLHAIYLWYSGCRQQLPAIFETLYNSGETLGETPDLTAFTNLIHAGAGPRNGTREQIRSMKLYEYLYDCELQARDAKRLQEELRAKS